MKRLKRDHLKQVHVCVTHVNGKTGDLTIHETALPLEFKDERLFYNGEWWHVADEDADPPRYERDE